MVISTGQGTNNVKMSPRTKAGCVKRQSGAGRRACIGDASINVSAVRIRRKNGGGNFWINLTRLDESGNKHGFVT